MSFSNNLIIDNCKVKIDGLSISNYLEDDEPRFKPAKRLPGQRNPLRWIVLHETGGSSATNTKNALLKRGKHHGVQLIVNYDGHISCHGDLYHDVFWHGNQLNMESIGIEFVNPYNPLMIPHSKEAIFNRIVDPYWWTWIPRKTDEAIKLLLDRKGLTEVPKKYVLPTLPQIQVAEKLVFALCEHFELPIRFPTIELNRQNPRIKRWKQRAKPEKSGIVAHRDFASHADGRFLLEYLFALTETKDIRVHADYSDPAKYNGGNVTYQVEIKERVE